MGSQNDAITSAIRSLTARTIAQRFELENERRETERLEELMASIFEIKGLGAAVADAKKGIALVRSETAGLSQDSSLLVTAIQKVREQIKSAHDDLQFEAETLGNLPTE